MKGLLKWVMYAGIGIMFLASCNSTGNEVTPVADTVIISGMKFHPDVLHINKWDTVVWINNDIVSHDVTEFPQKEWTSDTIPPGHSWKKVMGVSTDYFCSIHPTMKAKIAVRVE